MYECLKTLCCIAELDSDLHQQKACKTDHRLLKLADIYFMEQNRRKGWCLIMK